MEVDSREKPRAALDADQQASAAEAWGYAEWMASKMEQRHPGLDFAGPIAVRIVTHIAAFDPARSALRTWAINHARFAIADVLRLSIPLGFRRGKSAPRVYSHDAMQAGLREKFADPHEDVDYLATTDPVAEWEQHEAARRLLRGLTRQEAAVLWSNDVEGRPLRLIGAEMGISESRASQIRTQALSRLREIGRTG